MRAARDMRSHFIKTRAPAAVHSRSSFHACRLPLDAHRLLRADCRQLFDDSRLSSAARSFAARCAQIAVQRSLPIGPSIADRRSLRAVRR